MKTSVIFSYGTLKPGGIFWPSIESVVDYTRPATIVGYQLYDLGAFPAVLPEPDCQIPIQGVLLFPKSGMEKRLLEMVDRIEAGMYDPVQVEAVTESGTSIPARIYVWSSKFRLDPSTLVPDNVWTARPVPNNVWTAQPEPIDDWEEGDEEEDWEEDWEEELEDG